jgi:tRNA modification GTPase
MLDDTIAAIATPLGRGGLAIVRVSGPDALAVLDRCFVPAGKQAPRPATALSHTVHYGHIVLRGGVVDEVLATVLRAPRTYTREDMVEVSCHGGSLPAKLVLDAVLAAGARPAEPGEFTRRAFLHGRLDLTQAEAVADVIQAQTELALAAANEQLAGRLSRRINAVRDELLHVLAHIEAQIDFPDEDLEPQTREVLLRRLETGAASMDTLLRTADEGQILRRGLRAAIVGRPNVGKSSLLNQLLGHDRAIVSPLPGTTRDTIAETANVRGLPVVFVDTAGLRETPDALEHEGVRRTRDTAARAELVLHVLDCSEPWGPEDARYLAEFSGRKRLLIGNKTDLPSRLELPAPSDNKLVRVSCLTGAGIEELKDAIRDLVWTGAVGAEMAEAAINARHQNALARAREATGQTLAAMRERLSYDLVAVDLRSAVNALGEVVGKTFTDDLLDTIFSQFCIGK